MKVEHNKLVIIAQPKSFSVNLFKYLDSCLKYKKDFFINHNERLAERAIRNAISQLSTTINMKPINHVNTENNKTNEQYKFVLS